MNGCSERLPVVVLLYAYKEEVRNVELSLVDSPKTPREDISGQFRELYSCEKDCVGQGNVNI